MAFCTILFIADICGRPGRQAVAHLTKPLKEKYGADYVIANIENAAGGFGVTPEMSRKIFTYGVNMQTSGNHIWDRVQILEYLEEQPRLLRPANFPSQVPGRGYYVDTIGNIKIATISLMGRVYMPNTDCPFRTGNRIINEVSKETPIIFVDFHAEATSEKQAFLHYVDGKVSAVIGTHTHVPTADAQITRRGTAFQADAGMTGAHDSIIGMEKGPSLGRFLTGMPKRFTTATDDVKIMGVVVKVNIEDGRAEFIERFQEDFDLAKVQNPISVDDE